ncbi:hypothetical protein, partial [Undibacterium sp. CCC3.4]|uniref:hypothetical protein n=1 Tax=Undibacterium sp. CCC3.4 TaxID=3048609 RepID=UPI002B22695E
MSPDRAHKVFESIRTLNFDTLVKHSLLSHLVEMAFGATATIRPRFDQGRVLAQMRVIGNHRHQALNPQKPI